ncbi:MAG: hypothetical protein LBD88_01505 [Candidatus Peribacteria bacterium]|jgi:hypothetical protein|nr:hypothetical protein [Candidatus Peribacteria bacterium]
MYTKISPVIPSCAKKADAKSIIFCPGITTQITGNASIKLLENKTK